MRSRPQGHRVRPAAHAAGATNLGRGRGLFGVACLCLGLVAFLGSSAPSSAAGPFPGQGFLPDNRAWEMVSPVDKLGADVMARSSRVRAAADCSASCAVGFVSLGGFADVVGTGISTEYLALRAPGGWSTHATTPPQDSSSIDGGFKTFEPIWESLSADLGGGTFRAWSPLPVANDDPNVARVLNLYVRDDLRSPGAGSYRLVSPCPACAEPLPAITTSSQKPVLADATDDFSKLIFESRYKLADAGLLAAPAATTVPKLYRWADGALEWVGAIPAGTDIACGPPPLGACVAAPRSKAGSGASNGRQTERTITADGSRVFFMVSTLANASQANGAIAGNLYVRDDQGTASADDDTTVKVNAVETGTGTGATPALFETASVGVDGGGRVPARVFFSTSQQLTADDVNSASDLYMWDEGAPEGSRLTRLSVDGETADGDGAAVQGVLGASEDGRFVYFAADGQLVADKPSLGAGPGLYAWHDGSLTYIGMLAGWTLDQIFNANSNIFGALAARVTSDGRHLLFVSSSGEGLLSVHNGKDVDQTQCTGTCSQLYLYNFNTDELACASCPADGSPPSRPTEWSVSFGAGPTGWTRYLPRFLSDDGRYVFFSTTAGLVAEDKNGPCPPPGVSETDGPTCTDAYQYDSRTGQVHLLSSGQDAERSFFMDASADGRDAFILTRERLSGWDTDGAFDLYDARVGGGLPEPPPSPPGCVGEACQGTAQNGAAPAGLTPSALRGAGDPPVIRRAAVKRCPAGKRKVRTRGGKTRCVRKGHRNANTDRRAGR